MSAFSILTDTSCDMPAAVAEKMGITAVPLKVMIAGKTFDCSLSKLNIGSEGFYDILRRGVSVKTASPSIDDYMRYFRKELERGKDVLYIGFSTALSGSYNVSLIAAQELEEEFPERKIICVDSLCGSMGLSMLIYHCAARRDEGATIEELEQFIVDTRDEIAHWFVVDDLEQLKRGGRISAAAAAFGKALQIKPLISCDETGKLVNVGKIRGKSNVIPTLEKHVKRDAVNPKKSIAFVAHADNPEGAKELRKAIKGMFKEVQICPIGPVIGSHVGPGMLAVVFKGKRNLTS